MRRRERETFKCFGKIYSLLYVFCFLGNTPPGAIVSHLHLIGHVNRSSALHLSILLFGYLRVKQRNGFTIWLLEKHFPCQWLYDDDDLSKDNHGHYAIALIPGQQHRAALLLSSTVAAAWFSGCPSISSAAPPHSTITLRVPSIRFHSDSSLVLLGAS